MQDFRPVSIAALATVAALGFAASITIAQPKGSETFVANAINMGSAGHMGRQGGLVQITIERWSAPEERQTLVEAFRQKGANGLLSALQKTPRVGYMRTPDRLGWDLHYAVQKPDENGGRRILIATDRAIGFWEASRDTRSNDYPFTLVELRLGADGKGEGRLSLATKISLSKDKTHIELENYSSEPVRLQNVRKQE